jgi:hypothetical protein
MKASIAPSIVTIGVLYLFANIIAFFGNFVFLVPDILTIIATLSPYRAMIITKLDACLIHEHRLSPICLSRQVMDGVN